MEEERSFQDNLAEIAKKNWLVLALLAAGLIFVGVGVVQMSAGKTASVKFEKGVEVAGASTDSSTAKIKVDVEGEVINPGVYTLKGDARVQDALIAAGGLSANANRNSLNLAQKISDGQKIYVPAVGETVSTTSIMGTTGITGGSSEAGVGSTGLISINNGSQSELESLPGIGPVTATKVIDNRPYGSIEELKSKKAVGSATYEKIKDLITL